MKHQVDVNLQIIGDPDLFFVAIEPENSDFFRGVLMATKMQRGIKVIVSGRMTIESIKFTIDDILKASILASKVDSVIRNGSS